jgi:hypothetical protein
MPVLAAKEPGEQATQAEEALTEAKEPLMQVEQELDPDKEKLPAKQREHMDLPFSGCKNPAEQVWQTVAV